MFTCDYFIKQLSFFCWLRHLNDAIVSFILSLDYQVKKQDFECDFIPNSLRCPIEIFSTEVTCNSHQFNRNRVINIAFDQLPIVLFLVGVLFFTIQQKRSSNYFRDISEWNWLQSIIWPNCDRMHVVKLKSIIPFHNNLSVPSIQNKNGPIFFTKNLEMELFLNTSVNNEWIASHQKI